MPRVDGWLVAADGYEVALVKGKVVARKAGGAALKSIPKQLRDGESVTALRQLQEWLDRHEKACQVEVEGWLVRSLPVPLAVLASVWPDCAWRDALRDLVTVPVDEDGAWRLDEAGLLRDADPGRGLGVVNLDGDTVWLTPQAVAFPHPVLLDDLDDLREFVSDLGVHQATRQLFREIWRCPTTPVEREAEVRRYEGGRFAQLRHLTSRAASLGYAVRGGYATYRIWEGGRGVVAAVWVGMEDPSTEAYTGSLAFTDAGGAALPLAEVGPVAWSEGMRMAAALFAGRVVEEGEQP
jgi:hypothetical protein